MTEELLFRLHVEGPATSYVFLIVTGETIIGRQAGSDLLLDHPQVSRRHARIDCAPADRTVVTECQITDLGSSNGTYVDDIRLHPDVPAALIDGAAIKIGPFTLTFEQVAVELPPEMAEEELLPEPVVSAPEPTPEIRERPEPLAKAVERAAPPPPTSPPPSLPEPPPAEKAPVPAGLSLHSRRLLRYLPGIYHSDFMSRFLALFESILIPLEWNIDNFDLYLDPGTAPTGFLPWLANWFEIAFDPTWSDAQRRALLQESHQIYARRGTRWALSRVLEIYTGQAPEIIDRGQNEDPFTFGVELPVRRDEVDRELVERVIDASKPAHTTYTLAFKG